MPDTTFIYVLNDPRTNQVRYVGKADNPLKRWRKHCAPVKIPTHKSCWIAGLRKEGLTPELEILEEVPVDQHEAIEREYIRVFRMIGIRLTNRADGGGGGGGWKHPEEVKAKISAASLGRNVSEETRESISKSLLGRRHSPERIENIIQGRAQKKQETRSTSKFMGACWIDSRKRWRAFVTVSGKQFFLGQYKSEIDAAIAHDWVANLYGMKLNFPEKVGADCS